MRSLVCLCLVAWLVSTQAQTPAAGANPFPKNSLRHLSRSMLMTSGTFTGSDGRSATITATAAGDKGAAAVTAKTPTIHSNILDQVFSTSTKKVAVFSPATGSQAVRVAVPVQQAGSGSIALARRFLRATSSTPAWAQPQIGHGKHIDDSSATVQQQDAAEQIRGLVKPGSAGAALPDWAQPQIGLGKNIDDSSATVQQQDAQGQIRGVVKPGYAKAALPDYANQQMVHGKNIGDDSATIQQQDAGDQIRGFVNSRSHTSG